MPPAGEIVMGTKSRWGLAWLRIVDIARPTREGVAFYSRRAAGFVRAEKRCDCGRRGIITSSTGCAAPHTRTDSDESNST